MTTFAFCQHLVTGMALGCVIGLSATAAPAREPRCRGNSGLIGRCYRIRGLYALSSDSAMIVVRDDTGRRVIIRGAHHRQSAEPSNLIRFATKIVRDTGDISLVDVHGDFEVCRARQDGFVKGAYACIQSAINLKRVSPDWESQPKRSAKIRPPRGP